MYTFTLTTTRDSDPLAATLDAIMADIDIRKATLEDVAAIMLLVEPLADAGKLFRRTRDEIEDLLPGFFVAVVDSQVVGCCAIEIYSRKLAEIQCLAVHSDFRRHGLGKRLVDLCVEVGQTQGIAEIMAITSDERFFRDCDFDFSLPNAKKALFYRPDRI